MEKNLFTCEVLSTKESANFFLASDLHIEDILFDEKRFRRDFKLAVERNCRIFLNGDVINGIIRTDQKRYDAGKDRYADKNDQLNRIVEDSYEVLAPYADHIDLIGIGNHEVALIKHATYDPTRALIGMLNQKRDSKLQPIIHGGYTGFIHISVKYGMVGSRKQTGYDIYYNHGQGSSAEVSKGMIDLQRHQSKMCDLVWLGHKHQRVAGNLDTLYYLNRHLSLETKERLGVVTGCYLKNIQQYDINEDGYRKDYGEERMRIPHARGGAFLYLSYHREDNKIIAELGIRT